MSKKKEYEEVFNKLFGTSIKWSKLSVEELTQLATVLTNTEFICKKLCKSEVTEEPTTTIVKTLKSLLKEIKYEGPVIKVLRKAFGIEVEEGEEKEEVGGYRGKD